ncbi:NAD(P)-binding protein [Cylindrobasidium torrendii FP15055 ss-10]|uniref:NAD(P)-binding protein n=1 Tax=Cylindrobasidium torrendii FP15055 ss-10 TaxID=1314674 RepID=A0A0D7B2R6_9AGAR|nr:NAD(P)-binding protein [Cylindrobasidium torrendii FP15055 ss-10]
MFVRGEPLANLSVGRVVRSEDANYEAGDHVYGFFTFEEYSIVHSNMPGIPPMSKLPNKEGLPWSVYVGAAGMPGMTAYFGYHEYAEAKRGQTIFVSSGAGAVGSQVIQLAKIDGLKVIASAGSDDKVAFMKEIGADVAFNYKTTDVDKVLEEEGPLDIYWDHVGGSTLDTALGQMNLDGRVLVCGMIAGYNVGQAYSYKNLAIINSRTLLVKGFYVMDPRLVQKWSASFSREVPALLANGNLKYKEDKTPFAQTWRRQAKRFEISIWGRITERASL